MTIAYFIIALTLYLIWNNYLIKSGGVNHLVQFLAREIVWTVGAFIFYEDNATFWTYFAGFNIAFMFPFNIGLNLLRGLSWNYIGNTAWIDKQGRKWPAMYWGMSFLFMLMGLGFLIWPLGY